MGERILAVMTQALIPLLSGSSYIVEYDAQLAIAPLGVHPDTGMVRHGPCVLLVVQATDPDSEVESMSSLFISLSAVDDDLVAIGTEAMWYRACCNLALLLTDDFEDQYDEWEAAVDEDAT